MILPRGDHTVDLEHGTFRRTLLAWITLHIVGGQFLLPILFLTFAFTRAKRHPVLVNMCAVWIFGSTIACLVFYAGKYNLSNPARTASEPLCRAQAVMMQHAVAAMLCTSAFTLIYHVWSTARASSERHLPESLHWIRRLRTPLLIMAPYLAFLVFCATGLVNVLTKPDEVSLERRKLYCAGGHSSVSVVAGVYYAVVLLATAVFQVLIVLKLRRRRSEDQARPMLEESAERALLVRVAIFGVYVVVAFVLSLVGLFLATVAHDIFIATAPTVIFIIFGWQKDVHSVWLFWRRHRGTQISTAQSSEQRLSRLKSTVTRSETSLP